MCALGVSLEAVVQGQIVGFMARTIGFHDSKALKSPQIYPFSE